MTDIDALRKVAEGATPREWYVPEADTWEATIRVRSRAHRRGWRRVGQVSREADAAYIAAANPTAILDLLDRLSAAEAAVARCRALPATYNGAVLLSERFGEGFCAGWENAIGYLHAALDGDA